MDWYKDELKRDALRYESRYSRKYKTEDGLWKNQSYGSYEAQYVKSSDIEEAIAEYRNSENWD